LASSEKEERVILQPFSGGDPLKDMSILENVEFVMKDGKVYKQAGVMACAQ
jgi:hypothetical protein